MKANWCSYTVQQNISKFIKSFLNVSASFTAVLCTLGKNMQKNAIILSLHPENNLKNT